MAMRAAGSKVLTELCVDIATNNLLVQEGGKLGMGGPLRTEHTDAVSATSPTFTSSCGAAMNPLRERTQPHPIEVAGVGGHFKDHQ